MGVDEAMRTGVRIVRALLTAGTVMALAAGAHRLGGGALPPFAGLLGLGSIVLLLATFLSRWDLTPAALLPLLGSAQYALHHALGFLSVSGEVLPARGMHDAMSGIALPGVTGAAMGGMTSGMSVSMTATHAAATVATAFVLVGADRAARMALHWWCSVLPLVHEHRPAPPVRLRHLVPYPAVQVGGPCAALRRSDPRRGPPPLFA